MITNELNRMTTVSKNRLLTFFCLMHDSNYGNPMNGYDGIFIDLIWRDSWFLFWLFVLNVSGRNWNENNK